MTTVDALIIAKDNEQTISRAVASVRERVDRVLVVVDPLTKDATRERALEAGAEVEEGAPFIDFATARNDAIERARADHVVMVDSDDALAFTSAFRGWPSDLAAYSLRVVEGSYRWTRVLYFHRSLRFKGRAHEVLDCGDGLPPEVAGVLYHRTPPADGRASALRTIALLKGERDARSLFYRPFRVSGGHGRVRIVVAWGEVVVDRSEGSVRWRGARHRALSTDPGPGIAVEGGARRARRERAAGGRVRGACQA